MMKKLLFSTLISASLALYSGSYALAGSGNSHSHSHQKNEESDSWSKSIKINDNLHIIESKMGGNVILAIDDKNGFLVDNQLKGKSESLQKVIKSLTDKPVEFILNTHFHFDHAGGNEYFSNKGAKIIAHDNVRKTLAKGTRIEYFNTDIKAEKYDGLPNLTFPDKVSITQNNGEVIDIIHFPNAHTDGDAVVFFKTSNVIATGDILFNELFPFVDIQHGGSINGVINALKNIVKLSDKNTKIIPGHGKVTDINGVEKNIKMLENILKIVTENKNISASEIAQIPELQEYKKDYNWKIVTLEKFIGIVLMDINSNNS